MQTTANTYRVCFVLGAAALTGHWPDPKPGDMIIAADAGWKHLATLGWTADTLIGDFDSAEPPPDSIRSSLCKSIVCLPAEKDDTDMAAAIQLGLDAGCGVFYLLGGTGGRLDHTLANIQCLASLAELGRQAYLADGDATLTAIAGGSSLIFPAGARGTVSVFAHSNQAEGVTLEGFKYTLVKGALANTRALGVSNEFLGARASIHSDDGTLIVVFPGTLSSKLIRTDA
ncbi:thiamine pyrophosphokinase [Clostridia bacterium]|nr:thiamine pyrophosphokinase [Clostridia bacterium]